MPVVGRVSELWRYPVKSMTGEILERVHIGSLGIDGDRGWALRDEQAGEIRGAKKLPRLLECAARYLGEPTESEIPPAEIELSDGSRLRTDDGRANVVLSELLGRAVTIWPRQPAASLDHYRRGLPDNPDIMGELRQIFGRTETEPLPDLSLFAPELLQYTSPLGTYFDAFPIHVLTTASLRAMRQKNPGGDFDARRFRPNILIETEGSDLIEQSWCGKTIQMGGVRIAIELGCVRCVMPTLPQRGVAKDPSVLRTIVKDAAQNLGVYGRVAAAGEVRIGDEIELLA